MPLKFWDEAFITAAYLISRLPSRVIHHETPLERVFHTQLDYIALRTFGCACWPNLRPYNTCKLAFRSIQCVFLGYSNLHKGFKCIEVKTWHVYISRDVIFDEVVFPFSKLHPNASAQLRREISLLPESLTNSIRDDSAFDLSDNSMPTNDGHESSDDVHGASARNSDQSRSNLDVFQRHFMSQGPLSTNGWGADREADTPVVLAHGLASEQAPDPASAPMSALAAPEARCGGSSFGGSGVIPSASTCSPPTGGRGHSLSLYDSPCTSVD
jgi:hypothetical protein